MEKLLRQSFTQTGQFSFSFLLVFSTNKRKKDFFNFSWKAHLNVKHVKKLLNIICFNIHSQNVQIETQSLYFIRSKKKNGPWSKQSTSYIDEVRKKKKVHRSTCLSVWVGSKIVWQFKKLQKLFANWISMGFRVSVVKLSNHGSFNISLSISIIKTTNKKI